MKLQYDFKMQNFEFGLRVVGVDCGIVGFVGLWVVGEIIYTW